MSLQLTVDQKDRRRRAAVWNKGVLQDLYLDDLEAPDVTGAVVIGKLARIGPALKVKGARSGWFEGGLSDKIYVDQLPAEIKEGDRCRLKITSSQEGAKACSAKILAGDAPDEQALGCVQPPPPSWLRAIEDGANGLFDQIVFHEADDYRSAQAVAAARGVAWPLCFSPREQPHPQLDDLCDELVVSRIPLAGGGSLVIEKTEAFWAVDINAGEARNPLSVNMAAMREIARRMRLCNMGGIILIDALRLPNRADTSKMLNVLRRATASDPAKAQVYGQTKLGIVEVTRMRRGASLFDLVG